MKHFTKTVCIVDTCSIINLDNIQLARHDVLHYMRLNFDVHVCSIIRDELRRHREKVTSREVSYWDSFLSTKTFNPTKFTDDSAIIGPFYSTTPRTYGEKNAGEHGNARIALELLFRKRIGHAVFVTDDENAINSFLNNIRKCFPSINIWSSADVILYLGAILISERKTDFENVRAALRDVYAHGARKWADRTDGEKSKIIINTKKSVDSLRLAKSLAIQWRN